MVNTEEVSLVRFVTVVVMWTRGGLSGSTPSLVQEMVGGAVSPMAEQKRRTTDPFTTELELSMMSSRSSSTVRNLIGATWTAVRIELCYRFHYFVSLVNDMNKIITRFVGGCFHGISFVSQLLSIYNVLHVVCCP